MAKVSLKQLGLDQAHAHDHNAARATYSRKPPVLMAVGGAGMERREEGGRSRRVRISTLHHPTQPYVSNPYASLHKIVNSARMKVMSTRSLIVSASPWATPLQDWRLLGVYCSKHRIGWTSGGYQVRSRKALIYANLTIVYLVSPFYMMDGKGRSDYAGDESSIDRRERPKGIGSR